MSIKQLIYISIFLGIISSCKVAQTPDLPPTTPLPSTFTEVTDSSSIGDIEWKNFFKDTFLVRLIDTALNHNPDLLIAIQRIEMARSNVLIRKGALLPSVNGLATADVGRMNANLIRNGADQSTPNLNQEYFVGLQSTWEIDLWGKLRNRKKAAYTRLLASEKGQHLVTTTLVADLSRLYYELLGLDSELEIIRSNVELQEIALEMIEIQKAGGRATELAVQQFSAQLLSTKALEAEKKQQIVEVENQINFLLGRFPQPIERGSSIREQNLPPELEVGIPADMLRRRPDIQQAELALLASGADVEAARAAFFPSLTLSPYLGFNAIRASTLVKPEALALGALAGLSAPLFNMNRIKANYNRSIAMQMESYHTYQRTILNGYQEVISSLKRIENYSDVYDYKEEEVEVLIKAVNTSNDLFMAGYASYLEVITAQKSVLEAELGSISARKEIFLSIVDLYKALGGGWK